MTCSISGDKSCSISRDGTGHPAKNCRFSRL